MILKQKTSCDTRLQYGSKRIPWHAYAYSSSRYSSFAATSPRIPLAANTGMGPNIAPLSVPPLATGVSEV